MTVWQAQGRNEKWCCWGMRKDGGGGVARGEGRNKKNKRKREEDSDEKNGEREDWGRKHRGRKHTTTDKTQEREERVMDKIRTIMSIKRN